jgi:pSer/pThr/pTyr-binding forkhead associated (FHA) protein
MSSCALHLFDTNLADLEGSIPNIIDLTEYMEKDNSRNHLIIGRGSPAFPADVVLNATHRNSREANIISRNHIKLTYSAESGWEVEDLKSLNGTYVNRKRINRASIQHGDVLQLGGVSNIPIGDTINESGLSIKYRFSWQSSKSKNKRVTDENIVNKTPKRSVKMSSDSSEKSVKRPKSSTDSDLDEAHAALNRIHAGKDARISELELALQKSQKTNQHISAQNSEQQSKLQLLEMKHLQQDALVAELKLKNEELQNCCASMRNENIAMRDRVFEMQNANKDFQSNVSNVSEKTIKSEYLISKSALRLYLDCALCENVLDNPVVTSCSHEFCHACLSKASENFINASFYCPQCRQTVSSNFFTSKHLKAIVALHSHNPFSN